MLILYRTIDGRPIDQERADRNADYLELAQSEAYINVYSGWRTVEKDSEPPEIEREDFGRFRYQLSQWEPTIIASEIDDEQQDDQIIQPEEPITE